MKKVLLLLIIFGVNFLQVAGQNPSGFNYQAVFRNSAGEIIQNQSVGIRISILKGSSTGDAVYIETFSTTTNSFGLVNLVVGSGSPKEGALSDVEWSSDSYFIKVEVDFQGGSNYAEMGTTQLLSVPYAMHAKSASQFKGEPNGDPDAPLFEVKNSKGAVVFAVYENEVKIFIDEEDDGKTVGGFAVSGRTTTKEVQDLLTVAPGETRLYVDESSGKTVGGFAVSGRTTTKEVEDILHITTDNTQIYVGEGNGKTVGGFAVSGRTTTKEVEDILHITPENTQIYVGEGNGKTVGGFAVSGRTTTKEVEDILHITPENTQIYVGEGNGKTVGGFAVSGRTTTKGVEDILQITPDNTRIYVSESDGKTVGGFAVSGRTTTKEEGFYDVLKVVPERTDVFIKPPVGKLFPDGFSVSVYNEQLVPTELFNVSEEGIFMNNEVIVAPVVETDTVFNVTQTSATVNGRVVDYPGSQIIYSGITYSTSPNPVANIEVDPTPEMGTIFESESGFGVFYTTLYGLNPGTQYYCRAFAINQDGLTGYGAQKTFTTLDPYIVNFNVLDEDIYDPINNAMITLNGITNPIGQYQFSVSVDESDYFLYSVIAEGYEEAIGEVFIYSDTTFNIYLTPAVYSVVFTVKDQFDNPIRNVQIWMTNGSANASGTTNEFGIAICTPPEPGAYSYYVDIYEPGYEDHPGGTITISDPGIIYESIMLNKLPMFTVTFHVLTPQGDPCVNAEVTLEEGVKGNGEKWYSQTKYTDASGYATFEEVYQSAEYNYFVYHPNYELYSDNLDVNEDMLVEVQLETSVSP